MKVRITVLMFGLSLLSACSSPTIVKEPTLLADLESPYALSLDWQVKLESTPNRDAEGLFFAEDDKAVYIANSTGYVAALEKNNTSRWIDQVLWETKFSEAIVSGPTQDGDHLIIGTAKGKVMALSMTDGHILWQTQLSSEVLSAPVIAERKIFTRTVDGKLYALNANTGEVIWEFEHQMPTLSLRGAPPVIYADGKVYVGWESGMVQSLSAKSGELLWEARVAVPKGRTDLERMIDVQAGLVLKNDRLFVLGFHGKLAAINPENGNYYFVKELSGFRDFVVDDTAIYVADEEDVIYAFDVASGEQLWKQAALKNRGVGDIIMHKDELLIADSWGYLHWLNKLQGTEYARVKRSNEYGDGNVVMRMMSENGHLFVLDDEGVVCRYEVAPSNLALFKAEHADKADIKQGEKVNE